MISVILENSDNNILSTASLPGNEQYLIRDSAEFPLLSQLSEFSYDVYSHADMIILISELEQLKEEVSHTAQTHIDEIIEMAIRCQIDKTTTLTFTPFD